MTTTQSTDIPIKPIVVFSDASFNDASSVSAFGLLFEQLPGEFDVSDAVLEKFHIEPEDDFSDPPAKVAVSGLVSSVDPTSAEIMAIIAAFEILRSFPVRHRVIVYCDNLAAVKWMGGSCDDMHEPFERYSRLIEYARAMANRHDWRVEKIDGHAGLPGNEAVDTIAKRRMDREQAQ